ncbi:tRNA threonylcarbamoyladenosine dehydratase [Desulfoscipio geothermicus]|uniref:tRNA A37 threonylcarbamoyladenosine dehydratase n=1 Tax=Desulfoscipio geothermicus DSM 3669 TaxID=1121426 RepID=A0A1I6DC57_9FIRM|nr:tRNA threonylcarbamoyladenosine dehydratase [Desulfoscipio geothermicus]SFR03019.1 tRNA A37 threonylcarbamoyladenosine dehydratase [Desulfoscipio geothermicus DSM 3669]
MSHRFDRTEMLIGRAGLEKLAASKVAIFGLGGVGSFAAEALCRAGVGYFLLVDHDVVDVTNINRQLHALTGTVGEPKTGLMADRLHQINPAVTVQVRQQKFTPDRAAEMLDGRQLNFVVDAIDDVENKAALIVACVRRHLPVISAMGAGNKLDPTSFKVDSIWNTAVCPLARVMRKKLRDAGISAEVPVVYSTARPMRPAMGNTPAGGRGAPGSISYVPPVAGLIMAGFVTDRLLGLGVFSKKMN